MGIDLISHNTTGLLVMVHSFSLVDLLFQSSLPHCEVSYQFSCLGKILPLIPRPSKTA